jgi:membrane protein
MAGRLSPRQTARYTLLESVGSGFWQVIFFAGSYLVTVALFVLVYRFMPRAPVTWKDTLPGIFAASLSYFHYDQIYGSVGAVVAVLTWSYVSSLILLFGAQLTAVFHYEHPVQPNAPV